MSELIAKGLEAISDFRFLLPFFSALSAFFTLRKKYPVFAESCALGAFLILAGRWLHLISHTSSEKVAIWSVMLLLLTCGILLIGRTHERSPARPRLPGNYPVDRPSNLFPSGGKLEMNAITLLVSYIPGFRKSAESNFPQAYRFLLAVHDCSLQRIRDAEGNVNKIMGGGFVVHFAKTTDTRKIVSALNRIQREVAKIATSHEFEALGIRGMTFCLRRIEGFIGPSGCRTVYSDYSFLGAEVGRTFNLTKDINTCGLMVGKEIAQELDRTKYVTVLDSQASGEHGIEIYKVERLSRKGAAV